MQSIPAAYTWLFPTHLEMLAFVTGVAGVWLMARQHLLAWPVGLVNVMLYAVIFTRYRLYADATLQLYFFGMLAYGWWHWLHPGPQRAELPTVRITSRTGWVLSGLTAAAALGVGAFLQRFSDSTTPYWDACPTAMSFAAQWMQARKHLENWLVWIVANVLYIGLYIYKGMNGVAVLYGIFILLAIKGWIEWRRAWRSAAD